MILAIISDIHEDYENLLKILAKAESKGFDKLICLGDISGFSLPYYKYSKSRNASACLNLLREKCDIITLGNHDLHSIGKNPEIQESLKGLETWEHHQDLATGYSEEDISFLNSLPLFDTLTTPAGKILFSHYVYPNLSGYVKGFYSKAKEFNEHFTFMQKHNCSISFTGHSHPIGYYKVKPSRFRYYHNRGIKIRNFPTLIGVPPLSRNQNQKNFCIFDTISRKLQVFK